MDATCWKIIGIAGGIVGALVTVIRILWVKLGEKQAEVDKGKAELLEVHKAKVEELEDFKKQIEEREREARRRDTQ